MRALRIDVDPADGSAVHAPPDRFEVFEHGLHTHLKTSHAALLKKIEDTKALDKAGIGS